MIFSLKAIESVTLENRLRALIPRPNRDVLNIEDEIKKIHFTRYDEESFHDSGSGIEVTDWDEIVDAIADEYGIPDKEISRLRLAKKMAQRDAKEYKYKISEEKKGEFKYLQIVVGKDNGLMSYMLVGTHVNFKIKPVVQTKTTFDLFFFKIEQTKDEFVPAEVENQLEDYFLYKAQLSAGLHHGFKDDTCNDRSCM